MGVVIYRMQRLDKVRYYGILRYQAAGFEFDKLSGVR